MEILTFLCYYINVRPRSLMDKIRVCGTRDWEFESPRGHQKFKIAN